MAIGKFRIGVPRDALDKSGRPIFDPALLDMLADPAVEWAYYNAPVPELTPAVAADFDALCVMGGRIGRAGLAVGRVRLIARFGVGYDNVNVPACTDHGVLLTLAPDGVRRPVATSVIALMLALAHKLLIKDKLTRAGRWAEKLDHIGTGLTGRTLGAIGMGNIGAEVFRLAQPFGLRLIAHDPLAKPEVARSLGVELVDFDTVLRTADFVSVMCPLSEQTRGLIGPRELGLMKPTAYLINTARGPIVQEKALTEALAAGRIAGAGLDVFEIEPTPADNPLLRLDNVIVTPHGICFTDECLDGLARSVFAVALAVAHNRRPAHVVNPEAFGHPALRHLKG